EWIESTKKTINEFVKDVEKKWEEIEVEEDIIIPIKTGIDWTTQDLMPDITENISNIRDTIQNLSDEMRLEDEEIMDIGESFKEGINKDTDLSDEEKEMSASIWDFVVGIYNIMKEVIGLVFVDIPELIATTIARGMQEANLLDLGAWMAGRLIRGFADVFMPGFVETIQKTAELLENDDIGTLEKIKKLTGIWREQMIGDLGDLDKEMQKRFEEDLDNDIDLEQELWFNRDRDSNWSKDREETSSLEKEKQDLSLSPQDKKDIALMTRLEARGEPFEGQAGVAETIINRLLSDEFPNTVEEILTQSNQFEPADEWKKLRNTNIELNEQLKAVERALSTDIIGDATYFGNLEIIRERGVKHPLLNEDRQTTSIGDHTFGYQKGTTSVPGRGRGDKVPAMLEPGEAVVPRDVVRGGINAIANWFRNAQGYQSGTTGDYEEQAGVVKIPVIGNILQDILAEHDELYSKIMGELDPIFEESEDKWENIDENAKLIIEDLKEMEDLEAEDLESLIENVKGLGNELENISDVEDDLPDLDDLGEDLDEEMPGENRPKNFFEAMEQNIRQSLPLLDTFINEWQYMMAELNKLDEEEKIDLSKLKENFKQKALEITPDFVIDLGQSIKQGLSGLGQSLSSFLGPQIMSALGPIGTIVGVLIGESSQFKDIMNTLQPVLQAVVDIFGALIAPLEPIINLLTWLTPIFEALGMILQQAIEPIFRMLFPVIKLVAMGLNRLIWVVQVVRRGFYKTFLEFAKGVDSLPFVSAGSAINYLQNKVDETGKSIDDLDKSYDELKDMSYENAKAKEEEKEKTEELNDQLRNAPEIFNRAFARAEILRNQDLNENETTSSRDSSGKIDTSSSNTDSSSGKTSEEKISIDRLVVNINGVNDPREIWRKLKKIIKEENYNKYGFTRS
ncbi:MAG: cell wall hydrolase, partial [Halanaerobiales bacterium]